jgi:hypothetical protein
MTDARFSSLGFSLTPFFNLPNACAASFFIGSIGRLLGQ